ncbi:MAG TPA: purine-nucleoside phosphorylase [Candidatus Acetothermia bacterium]|nr:purine-nucleoside phosphorylase [Candidatus Acetothermia bacterium]
MHQETERLARALEAIRRIVPDVPDVAITLGSGLSEAFSLPAGGVSVPGEEIPGFPVPKVSGHAGDLWIGPLAGRRVILQRGRVHYYEGYSMEDVVFATRLFAKLGVGTLIVTNAAGAVRADIAAGDIVLLTDHINMLGANPLRGANLEDLGPRFPDLSRAYTPKLRALAHQVAASLGIRVQEGVYLAAPGPSYETPAEIRAFRALGADLVGMSTVPEVIVAAHAGMQVLGVSLATNEAAGVDPAASLTHQEVLEMTQRRGQELRRLLLGVLQAGPIDEPQ